MKKGILLIVAICFTTTLLAQNVKNVSIIETSATAETFVQPNKITLSITIRSDKGAGKKGMDEAQLYLFDVLKMANVDIKEEVKIISLNSSHRKKSDKINIYRTYSVVCDDIKNVGIIFQEANDKGIGDVTISSISNTEYKKYTQELTKEALLDAREQAKFQAEVLGQTIGSAVYISERYSSTGVERMNSAMLMGSDASADEVAVEVDVKDIKISVTYDVHFVLNSL